MIRAARAGGAVIQKYFGQTLHQRVKSDFSDVQTQADIESERAVVRSLRRSFPRDTIIGEEGTEVHGTSGYELVIDPLDGTNNFTLGVPYIGVTIVRVHEGRLLDGVVLHAMTGTVYHATAGLGAYRDSTRIRVSRTQTIARATVGYTIGYQSSLTSFTRQFTRLIHGGFKRVTNFWSPALDLCMIADSRNQAQVVLGNELYDYGAGKLIAREAGAIITDLHGRPEREETASNFLISCSQPIHRELVRLMK